MSTALSWTELRASQRDLASLLAFRRSGLTARSRRRLRVFGVLVLALTADARCSRRRTSAATSRASSSGTILALLPVRVSRLPRPGGLHRGGLGRRPRGDPARPGCRLPGLHDDRPPRGPAAGPAEHRLDHADLGAARDDVVRPGPRPGLGLRDPGAAVDRGGDGPRAGGRLDGRGSTPGPARHRDRAQLGGPPRRRCGRPDRDRNRWRPSSTTAPPCGSWSSCSMPRTASGAPGRSGRWSCSRSFLAAVVVGALPGALGAEPPDARGAAARVGSLPGPADDPLGLPDDAAHRPCGGLALGAAASRHDGAGADAGCRGARGRAGVADADRAPGPGGLRWRPALRREHLVPRRSRRPVARLAPGRPRGSPSSRAPWC